jgi:hypothetical protein
MAAARRVIPTVYKDCVEKHGYVKTGTDEVPLMQDHPEYLTNAWTNPWRLEGDRCGAPNQTCLWWMGQGRWTVAPLPRRALPPGAYDTEQGGTLPTPK